MPKLRGLIVDDVEAIREALKEILESDEEIEIVGMAANGQDAVKQASELQPDFITMDLQMPDMNGLQATREILNAHSIPILIIADAQDDELIFKALTLGASEVIVKSDLSPDKAEHLIQKIKEVVKS